MLLQSGTLEDERKRSYSLARNQEDDDMKGRVVNRLLLLTLCSMVLDHFAATAEDGNRMYCRPDKVVKPVRHNSGNRTGSVMPFGPRLILAVLVVSVFVSISVIAASGLVAPPAIEWSKTMGGWDRDEGYSVQQTAEGGYIVAGKTSSWDGDVTLNYGMSDYWIVKLNSTGNITWQTSIGGEGAEKAYSVWETRDGGYIVAGDSEQSSPHNSYKVLKLDSDGHLLWWNSLHGTDWWLYIANSVQQTADGGYIVAGGGADGSSGSCRNSYPYCSGGGDFGVVKLNSTGAVVWHKAMGGSENDVAESIQQTSDYGYIVAGYSLSGDGDVTGHHSGNDYWIVKLDSAGTLVWEKSLGGYYHDYAFSIQETWDGGYIVAGSSESNDGNVTGHLGNPVVNSNYWVVKLDSVGNIMWDRSIMGGVSDWGTSIDHTADGGYVVAGISDMGLGNYLGNRGAEDIGVVKLDSAGNIVWKKFLGGTAGDYGYSIQQTADGGYIVAGSSFSTNGDVYVPCTCAPCTRNQEVWVVKLGRESVVDPPIAGFTSNLTGGPAPLPVQFSDTSTYVPPLSWYWEFGDGHTSTEQNPVFIYRTPGIYPVNFHIMNESGFDWVNKTSFMMVTAPVPVVASFTAIPTAGTAPLAVQFSDTSTGTPASWNWSFGDGTWFNTTVASEKNPTYIFGSPGSFIVRLTVSNAAGSSSTIPGTTITVIRPGTPAPVASFTTNRTSGNAPLAVQFSDTSRNYPTVWNWSFGDGIWFNTTTASEKNPKHIFANPGSFIVQLTAGNAAGRSSTIPGTTITVTRPGTPAPVASFTANRTSGTSPLAVQFSDTSGNYPTVWNWSFGDGIWFNTTTASAKNPKYIFANPGSFNVRLTVSNAAGRSSTIPGTTITVTRPGTPAPVASFTANRTSGYAPLAVQFYDTSGNYPTVWNWSFGDGTWFNTTVASVKNPKHLFASPGSFIVRLMVSNAAGKNTTIPGTTITVR